MTRPLISPALAVAVGLIGLYLPVAHAEPATAGAGKRSEASAPRVIAAGGVITEIIYALGRSDLLVGVDSTSHYPEAALKDKKNVGYVRALSSEGLLSLRPSSVIAIDGAGPTDVLKAVAESGVKVDRVAEVPTASGIADKIRKVADFIDESEKGSALADKTAHDLQDVDVQRGKIGHRRKALFILSFQNGRAMVGGRNTSADGLFALAGLDNAAAGLDGWKPIGDEALVAAAPDLIVAMDHGPQSVTPATILAAPAFAATPAGRDKAVLVFDGEYLLSFGPRTPAAARDLMSAAYPELAKSDQRPNSQ